MNWLAWILGGLVVVGGGYAIAAAASAPSTSSSSGATWKRASVINPGDSVRCTMDFATLGQVVQSMPQLVPTTATSVADGLSQAWQALLASVHNTLTGNSTAPIQSWAPGQALPTDWPSDDTAASTGYHAAFTYTGAAPLVVSTLPILVTVWTLSGSTTATTSFPVQAQGTATAPPFQSMPINTGVLQTLQAGGALQPVGGSSGASSSQAPPVTTPVAPNPASGPTYITLSLAPGTQMIAVPNGDGFTIAAPSGSTILSIKYYLHDGHIGPNGVRGVTSHTVTPNAQSYSFDPGTFEIGTSAAPTSFEVTWGQGNSLTTQNTVAMVVSA